MVTFLKSFAAVMGMLFAFEVFFVPVVVSAVAPMTGLVSPVHLVFVFQWPAMLVLFAYFEVALLARGGRLRHPLIEGPLAGLLAGCIFAALMLRNSGGEGGLIASVVFPLVILGGLLAGFPVGLVYRLAGRGFFSRPQGSSA